MPGSHPVNPAPARVKLTYDDFVLFPDDGRRHEIIDGEHYVTASPNTKHQQVSASVLALIWIYLDAHPIGRVFHAPFDVVFSDFDVVEPDLLYLSNARSETALTAKHVRGVPELVVEIATPSTRGRDETIKRRLFERSGVLEYWVIEPELDVVRIYRHNGQSFDRVVELTRESGDVLTTPLLPDLQLPLERIFRT